MQKSNNNKSTIAIIPCYNEESTIGSIVLKTKRYVDEVLVVDDGSSDETGKIAKEAGATVISYKRNTGKANGIKTGFNYALKRGYNYVVTIDGDGQHNPSEIPSVLGNLINNGHDISIGTRYGFSTEMPIWRKIGKRILDYTTSAGNGGFVTDSQSGFRAFNKKAITELTPTLHGDAFKIESEQLIRAHELGLNVINTRISCKYKNLDTSSKNPASHGFSVLKYIIWLIAERRPLLYISVPGFILMIIGLFLGILTIQNYNQSQILIFPYAILVSIFIIIGAIGMFMGLVLNTIPHIIKNSVKEQIYKNED